MYTTENLWAFLMFAYIYVFRHTKHPYYNGYHYKKQNRLSELNVSR